MTERNINFVKAGDQDASEIKISTGTHIAGIASEVARETYTISYPSKIGHTTTPDELKEKFMEAAEKIILDADDSNSPLGE